MEKSGIKGYYFLITGDKEIPADDADKTKLEGFSELKLLNKTT